MPVVPTKQIVDRAFKEHYGVAAINVVNDLTLEAVLAAAEELARAADRPDLGQDGQVDRRRRAVRDVVRDDRSRSACRSPFTWTTVPSGT